MDTWMTSSLSPQINDGWATGGTDPALAPMSMRVQAFEIIRTWLFYSVVQSELLFGRVPWRTALISGWGLSEQGKKLSKRDLDSSAGPDGYNRYVPDDVMAKYGADALRLWATRGRIGTDLRYNEKDVRTGRKFTVKLWNVGRFVSMNLGGFDASAPAPPPEERDIVDRWVLSHLADAVAEVTAAFEAHDYMQAHQAASRMFWSVYCDRYIEMIKDRPDDSARRTLWESFRVLLGLFAPFAPFLTEHLYQRFYRAARGRGLAAPDRVAGRRPALGVRPFRRGPASRDPGRDPRAAQRAAARQLGPARPPRRAGPRRGGPGPARSDRRAAPGRGPGRRGGPRPGRAPERRARDRRRHRAPDLSQPPAPGRCRPPDSLSLTSTICGEDLGLWEFLGAYSAPDPPGNPDPPRKLRRGRGGGGGGRGSSNAGAADAEDPWRSNGCGLAS